MRLTNDTTELFKMFNNAIDMTKSKKKATLILNFENRGDDIEFFGILTNSGYIINPNKKLFKAVPNLEAVDLDYVVKNMAIIPDSLSIETLDLSVRAYNCLKRADIDTVGQIKQRIIETMADKRYPAFNYPLFDIRNIGKKSVDDILLHLMDMIYIFKEADSNES